MRREIEEKEIRLRAVVKERNALTQRNIELEEANRRLHDRIHGSTSTGETQPSYMESLETIAGRADIHDPAAYSEDSDDEETFELFGPASANRIRNAAGPYRALNPPAHDGKPAAENFALSTLSQSEQGERRLETLHEAPEDSTPPGIRVGIGADAARTFSPRHPEAARDAAAQTDLPCPAPARCVDSETQTDAPRPPGLDSAGVQGAPAAARNSDGPASGAAPRLVADLAACCAELATVLAALREPEEQARPGHHPASSGSVSSIASDAQSSRLSPSNLLSESDSVLDSGGRTHSGSGSGSEPRRRSEDSVAAVGGAVQSASLRAASAGVLRRAFGQLRAGAGGLRLVCPAQLLARRRAAVRRRRGFEAWAAAAAATTTATMELADFTDPSAAAAPGSWRPPTRVR